MAIAQPQRELGGEHGRGGLHAPGHAVLQGLRDGGRPARRAEGELVRERGGGLPLDPGAVDARGDASEPVEEPMSERDGDRPQLTDGERLHGLVRVEEAHEQRDVEEPVGEGDEPDRDGERARVPGVRALGDHRELSVEAPRKVLSPLAELLGDHVEVVEQPLPGGRDPAPGLRGPQGGAVVLEELPTVGPEQRDVVLAVPRRGAPRVTHVRLGELHREGVEALDGEVLRRRRLIDHDGRDVVHARAPGSGAAACPRGHEPGMANCHNVPYMCGVSARPCRDPESTRARSRSRAGA